MGGAFDDPLPGVRLVSSTGCTSRVFTHGAHVASWTAANGDDVIFLSSEVRVTRGVRAREGVYL